MDEDTTTQFKLISEIRDALDGAGISWWLFGGWAMDFRLGEITRQHRDIEVFVWETDESVVRAILEGRGFIAPTPLHPDEGQPFLKDGQEVGVTFLIKYDAGTTSTPGRWRDWAWPSGSFDGYRVCLDGVTAPAMSLDGLLDMKTQFAAREGHRRHHAAARRDRSCVGKRDHRRRALGPSSRQREEGHARVTFLRRRIRRG